jgi:malate dehydrogenase (oxaloacetate-decarboxylating)(NADP+)
MSVTKPRAIMQRIIQQAQAGPKRVVFPEGEEEKILRAGRLLVQQRIAEPILLGDPQAIQARAARLGVSLDGMEVEDPATSPWKTAYVPELYRLRRRRGVTLSEARSLIENCNVFGCMMVHMGDADALVSGTTQHYPETIRPALQIIRAREGVRKVSGLDMIVTRQGDLYFLADTTVNIEPSAEELAEIALNAAQEARRFEMVPRVALLSFSNFGSAPHPLSHKVRRAVELVRQADPDLVVDGEMQADTAVVPAVLEATYPFSSLKGGANVLIFPDLQSSNIAFKLLTRIGEATALGPILMGLSQPVHLLQRGAEVEDIVNITALAVVEAQEVAARIPPAAKFAPSAA